MGVEGKPSRCVSLGCFPSSRVSPRRSRSGGDGAGQGPQLVPISDPIPFPVALERCPRSQHLAARWQRPAARGNCTRLCRWHGKTSRSSGTREEGSGLLGLPCPALSSRWGLLRSRLCPLPGAPAPHPRGMSVPLSQPPTPPGKHKFLHPSIPQTRNKSGSDAEPKPREDSSRAGLGVFSPNLATSCPAGAQPRAGGAEAASTVMFWEC